MEAVNDRLQGWGERHHQLVAERRGGGLQPGQGPLERHGSLSSLLAVDAQRLGRGIVLGAVGLDLLKLTRD
ncbi:hypothetical protein MKL09_17520 [Methylobacterium sp. J-048]|uniref:hypothetical protein n=1 Tax=Methylobacterium sp. J-048 TaxID=2836635 RepID=UPI001FB89257|nr:hypothetical protein [Methylobacterium sp. J-048]MCJ2058343.1 hypothetical protein [Methylobacterium sp. J-048]